MVAHAFSRKAPAVLISVLIHDIHAIIDFDLGVGRGLSSTRKLAGVLRAIKLEVQYQPRIVGGIEKGAPGHELPVGGARVRVVHRAHLGQLGVGFSHMLQKETPRVLSIQDMVGEAVIDLVESQVLEHGQSPRRDLVVG